MLCLARDPRLDVAPAPRRVDDADRYANVGPQVPNEEIRNGAEGADVLSITRRPGAAGEVFLWRERPRVRNFELTDRRVVCFRDGLCGVGRARHLEFHVRLA